MKKTFITLFLLLSMNLIFSQTTYKCFDADNNPKLKISVKYIDEIPVSVKYKGQNSSIPLVSIKNSNKYSGANSEEAYNENYNGKITGKYIFTHSGNYDYIIYKGNNGKKVAFTINLEESVNENGDGYRNSPCY